MRDATQIIIRPLLTEKSVELQRLNKFTFEVDRAATKIEVRQAVELLGRCSVAKVNTLTVHGKLRRTRRGSGRTASWKKAVVTLQEGQSLGGDLGAAFENL